MKVWMMVPALGALMVLAVFLLGLQRDNAVHLPSTLINKDVPEFQLTALRNGDPDLTDKALQETRGQTGQCLGQLVRTLPGRASKYQCLGRIRHTCSWAQLQGPRR